jgi:hypothetical protein
MQRGKNWILPKEMNANRFFWDSHWLEIGSNHLFPSMGPNGGIVAMDSVYVVPPQGIMHTRHSCAAQDTYTITKRRIKYFFQRVYDSKN